MNQATHSVGHRDAIVELIMKNCKYDELGWAEMMLKTDGYQRIMEVKTLF